MTFQIGEKVVYPNHGVATIENISTRSFGTQCERFYLLRLSCNSLTVMVPFSHVGDVGLRKVTKNGEVARVLLYLASGRCKCPADWKNRFKENSEKMLDRARHMLLTEIQTSRGIDEDEAIDLLRKTLAKSSLVMPAAL